jgi:neuropeptide S receptor 1
VFSSPILYFYYTAEIPNYGTQCWITFSEQWQWQIYMTIVSMTLFVIPAILIAACYIIIVCTIWNKGKEMSVRPLYKSKTLVNEQITKHSYSKGSSLKHV